MTKLGLVEALTVGSWMLSIGLAFLKKLVEIGSFELGSGSYISVTSDKGYLITPSI